MQRLARYAPLPFILLALVGGVLGGLARVGLPMAPAWVTDHHGLLMTGGFLGTLIILERTVAQKSVWWRMFPLLSALGTVLLALGFQCAAITALFLGGSGLLAVYILEIWHHAAWSWYAMTAGALCWMAGNLCLLLTGLVPSATVWWMGFILLTIVGERLELTRYLPVTQRAKAVLMGFLAMAVAGMAAPFHTIGAPVMGTAVLFVSLWLLKYDMARNAAHKAGIHRYIGVGLLAGYGWLATCGLIMVMAPGFSWAYDLTLHTFFLGFAFSMIWAHAPIILPGVLRLTHQPFHPYLWIGWAMFQLSLLCRVTSTVAGLNDMRTMAATVNGVTILAMFASMAFIMVSKVRIAQIT
jgi:hypothetical protein